MNKTNSLDKQKISTQKKEIARLQKLLVKKEVQYESTIARLKAELAEEKKNKFKIGIVSYTDKT